MMKIFVFLSLFLIFVSCEEELNIKLDKHTPKLVINSLFSVSDGISLNLSRSVPILEKDTVNYVEDATVLLYCQNELVDQMNYSVNGKYELNTAIIKEKEYTVVINAPGFKEVSASSFIPGQPQILYVDTIHIDDEFIYCEIEFRNDPMAAQYYLLEVKTQHPVVNTDSVVSNLAEIINSDVIVENGNLGDKLDRLVFSGEVLQDSVYAVGFVLEKKLLLNNKSNISNTLYVQFKTISEAYYTYVRSMYSSQSKQDEIYSNVENGYGIFAGYSEVIDTFLITK